MSIKLKNWLQNHDCTEHLNFFRIHLICFIFIPLISAAIFYASNGEYHIAFIDALFMCYSAMTVTGLATVNLSTLTGFQQAMLYVLMLIGDFTVVSWIMVLVRKRFFRTHCEYISAPRKPRKRRGAISKDNIKISSPQFPTQAIREAALSSMRRPLVLPDMEKHADAPKTTPGNMLGEDFAVTSSPQMANSSQLPPETLTPTVSVATDGLHRRHTRSGVPLGSRQMTIVTRAMTTLPESSTLTPTKHEGFGGFPGPMRLLRQLIHRVSPSTYRTLHRKLTLPTQYTVDDRNEPWLPFGLTIFRNDDFDIEHLSDDKLELIGGAEYRALRFLSYALPLYFVGTQLATYLLFGPWLASTSKYDEVFTAQPRLVPKTWFSFFQVISAYTGGGLSLVDLGMVPFANAYLMIFALMFGILAGNQALVMPLSVLMLRSWIGSLLSKKGSETYQTCSFLLKHPRRCYLYLFPSHQTWFLVFCLVLFSAIEWSCFAVLDLGLEVYESLSVGQRAVLGLFQGIAARASGFSIVNLSATAPSLQFLYVVMMYIAVYPVAMSIRSTNVYEEKSLGVFEFSPDEPEPEKELNAVESTRERVGRYLGWHLRRQLYIDIWWLVWGVFLVAIIERGPLMDENEKWFDLFRVIFELVSAFGGIGLSLGTPLNNYSFSGALGPLSKLVIIVIMVRGRHRGLPVAVDRAVVLPGELVTSGTRERRNTTRTVDFADQVPPDPSLQSPRSVVLPGEPVTNGTRERRNTIRSIDFADQAPPDHGLLSPRSVVPETVFSRNGGYPQC
ncbi:TrkH-domain-containing protein [Fistulina hepatica ATCC 64428]|uniref:TrkH-domain-containing protein n=1 Tax=Fistulina hepatica ATCC 64428 TaxID=1128425 RepID=A0A0D7ADQ1_9AGAR|nr:TrkH-domain-containing protein [Fistulina hepatica ATCC 64428]